jgi:hypothetical protein
MPRAITVSLLKLADVRVGFVKGKNSAKAGEERGFARRGAQLYFRSFFSNGTGVYPPNARNFALMRHITLCS